MDEITLQWLMDRCKCGVFVSVNEHRDYYQSAEDWLKELDERECPPEIEPRVRAEMIASNTIVEIQFYPDTPIGCYVVHHYSLQAALVHASLCFQSDAAAHDGGVG